MRRAFRTRRQGPAHRRCTWFPARSAHPRRFSSRASVASIRPPVAPTGCPSEIPDPCTFVRSRSAAANFHSRITASAWAAKASLSSIRSMSDSFSPALPSAASVAGTGPIPMMLGATPADPQETSRTNGVSPSSSAFCGVVTMHMEAASFWPLEFPAVTVASGSSASRTGFSLLNVSTDVSARGCSSVSINSSPWRVRTATGMISSARIPSFCAATAR